MKISSKRFIAGLLATTLSLTAPLTSFALTGESAQGNDGGGIKTGAGGDFSANIVNGGAGPTSGKIGVRLSLVDAKDPSKVISVDDEGRPRVVDLLYVTKETFDYQAFGKPHPAGVSGKYHSILEDKYTFTNTKTQPLMDVEHDWDKQRVYRITYDEINSRFPGGQEMPPWLYHTGGTGSKGEYVSSGVEFVDWCVKNNFGEKAIGSDGNIFAETTTSAFGYQYTIKVAQKGNQLQYQDTLTGQTQTLNDSSEVIEKYNEAVRELRKIADSAGGPAQDAGLSGAPAGDTGVTDIDKEVVRWYLQGINAYEVSKVIDDINIDSTSEITDTMVELNEKGVLKRTMFNPDGSIVSASLGDAVYAIGMETGSPAIAESLKEQSAAATEVATGTGTDAGAAGTADAEKQKQQKKAHIAQILKWPSDTGKPLFQTPSMVNSRTNPQQFVNGSGEVETGELTLENCDEDWVLLVEPIVWLTIFPEGTDARGIHAKIYGTITNVVQAFNTDPILKPYANKHTLNYKALNYPVWWALTVKQPASSADGGSQSSTGGYVFDRTENGNPSFGLRYPSKMFQYRTFAELYESLTIPKETELEYKDEKGNILKRTMPTIEGWGVNAYWGKEEIMPPSIASTIEYDPDTTTTTKRPIKIAKWYVRKNTDEKGNIISEQTIAVKTGSTSTPVKIENELTEDGKAIWLVEKWGTGTEAGNIPSEGDLESKFEEYYKKAPGQFGGIEPAVLDLRKEPTEKVVYEKLVIIPITPPPTIQDITVIKVKEPADGSDPIIEKGTTSPGTYPAAETGWEYKQDIQTPDPEKSVTKWSDVPTTGTPGTNPNITVKAIPI